MSKRTLGRGLGDLLGSNGGTEPVPLPKPTAQAGLRILIAGTPQDREQSAGAVVTTLGETQRETASPSNETRLGPLTRILAVGGLASADLALLGWATHYVVTHKHILGFWGATACTCTMLVAAFCGTAAVSLVTAPCHK